MLWASWLTNTEKHWREQSYCRYKSKASKSPGDTFEKQNQSWCFDHVKDTRSAWLCLYQYRNTKWRGPVTQPTRSCVNAEVLRDIEENRRLENSCKGWNCNYPCSKDSPADCGRGSGIGGNQRSQYTNVS